ncbi:MAG: S9 family peptidase [Pseudomonadota bacterium]
MSSPLHAQEAEGDEKTAKTESVKDIAARFGVRASVLDISLSPSGTKIAWIAPGPRHTEILNVYDFEGSDGIQAITSNSEQAGDITHCDWVTDNRLLCTYFGMAELPNGTLAPYDRLFALDADGSNPKQISQRRTARALGVSQDGGTVVALDVPGKEGAVLITRNYVKERTTGTRLANDKEGLGVDRVDIENARRRPIEQPDERAYRYVADQNGTIRLKVRALADNTGRLTGQEIIMYRPAEGGDWQILESNTEEDLANSFSPIALNAESNSIYGYQSIDGFESVVSVKLDGSGETTELVSRKGVDVSSLIRIGRQRRVVGVSFATEKRSVEYFDSELAKLAAGLSKAIPNQPLISIVGASADEKRLVIIASSDTDPGAVYIYDKDKGTLEVLLAIREYLVDRPMGKMTPITYEASDGTKVPGYLTLPPGSDGKNLPTVVLPHGGPATRDYWGFKWIVQFFTARGYAVLQPNFRGSAGYGEAWFGRNGYQAWDVAIGDVLDAGRWMVAEGIADPDRLVIAGWSYGGYAALQSQVVDPDLYKAVVAIAPVTDLEYLRETARRYTSFRLRDEQLGKGPHIAAGSPRRHAENFVAPVALFHGDLDLNVDVRHSREMAEALEEAGKQVTYTEFKDLQHDLDDSLVRAEMLEAIDTFFGDAIGAN